VGLLDDAIREHLELKRRRGADPTEVARQEREALGPARRTAPPGEEERLEGDGAGEASAERHVAVADEAPPGAVAASAAGGLEDKPVTDPHFAVPFEPAPEDPDGELAPPDRRDVLEETPEFLEEAPEHDRLWFEQRPPRDFDF
jgi:hypothetical protein